MCRPVSVQPAGSRVVLSGRRHGAEPFDGLQLPGAIAELTEHGPPGITHGEVDRGLRRVLGW
jgi:hypothetical protein